MAAWQFDLLIVPLSLLLREERNAGRVDLSRIESRASHWEGAALPSDYETRLSTLFGTLHPIAEGWVCYGDETGTRVDLIFDEDLPSPTEVRARIDVRSVSLEQVELLLAFVNDAGAALISPNGNLVEPQPEALWVALQLSPAAAFVYEPDSFFAELRRKRSSEGLS